MVNLLEATPKNIAKVLFSDNYKEPGTYEIVADKDINDVYYIFEVLLNILVEGFDILTEGLDNVDTLMVNSEHFTSLNPWFKSIGFTINTDIFQYEDKFAYDDFYCKIIAN